MHVYYNISFALARGCCCSIFLNRHTRNNTRITNESRHRTKTLLHVLQQLVIRWKNTEISHREKLKKIGFHCLYLRREFNAFSSEYETAVRRISVTGIETYNIFGTRPAAIHCYTRVNVVWQRNTSTPSEQLVLSPWSGCWACTRGYITSRM